MFERFSHDARVAVEQAQTVARRLGSNHIGAEHVLLGATAPGDAVARRALARVGVEPADLERAVRARLSDALDADALAGLGIDLDAVREQVEATFGPGALDVPAASTRRGHIPFDTHAKKMLEVSLREAIRFQHRRIDTGHLLLAAARLDTTPAGRALRDLGADRPAVEAAVVATWADAA
ncbi:Clp protease N-terminal domain-containing protein [Cellulomonas fimi]|uniref:Clp domain protein n=1 Tax=Cellulomonas fimi (strain ATCC 484 / DSM 20113 / JCM 1341 / CCUG 24087 / LMG 16345 / NBRC 15513 / NCIMB 8980 / NCTC 7547 / NRS-133) TaxID=590998 RepID=F4H2L7_CELFA|nr:Clp protease N-terminal domain-containing protein [Cellulomonas fimi]AEE45243.1 Clp domain protein [Cellulomonas fimi ATCC 484]NNH07091.1 hypothetical protein [Cellulomonas fimi]VEH28685.1 Probable ATP-dependent Clp protease ATP-binding subunit [Cellulomonas fimi]